jgi:hypothetical protein
VLLVIAGAYVAGLAWGDRRLGWAALNDLADREIVVSSPAITLDRRNSFLSPAQAAFLLQRVRESPIPTTPRVHVKVRWNATVCARVQAGHYVGPSGAEWKETLFICLFGVWVPVYTYSHIMA